MILRTVPEARWKRELTDRGCKAAEGIPNPAYGEWWRYPKPGMPPFFVPYDDDDRSLDGWALKWICDDIRALCPDG